jgi:hypothetical protein
MTDNPAAALERAHAALQNRAHSAAEFNAAADQARSAVRAIDTESESAPQREAQILAGMASPGGPSMDYVLKELQKLDDERASRALRRKVAVALGAHLDERVREIEAREAARDPAEVRREREQAEREAKLQALYARVPVLFRTDYMVSKFGKAAFSRTPAPQGRQVSYIRSFDVGRALQHLMTETKVPGWPPRYGDFERITWPNSDVEEDESIVAPLRSLCERSSCSDAEVQIAIDRAQATLLNEFARVCAEIRGHYPDGLPRFFALPSIATARAMAAE